MKKVSTRAAAQIRNISQPKLTIGLDLGDRNSWYCVVNEAGQIQLSLLFLFLFRCLRSRFTWISPCREVLTGSYA